MRAGWAAAAWIWFFAAQPPRPPVYLDLDAGGGQLILLPNWDDDDPPGAPGHGVPDCLVENRFARVALANRAERSDNVINGPADRDEDLQLLKIRKIPNPAGKLTRDSARFIGGREGAAQLLILAELRDLLLGFPHCGRSGQRLTDGLALPFVGEPQGGTVTGIV